LYSPNIFQTTGSLATFHDPDILLLSRHFGSSTQIFKGPRPNNARTSSNQGQQFVKQSISTRHISIRLLARLSVSLGIIEDLYIVFHSSFQSYLHHNTLRASKQSLAAIDSLKSLYQMASTVFCQKPAVDYFSLATQRPQVSRAAICYNCLFLIARLHGYSGALSRLKHTIFQSDQSPV
jgi:hypothetical protein